MKKTYITGIALAVVCSAMLVYGQDSQQQPPEGQGPGGQGRGHHGPPPSPLVMALDANHDGIIDAQEIANASNALKSLDKNGDGQLTQDEICPPRPDRPPGGGDQQQDGGSGQQQQGHPRGPQRR